MGEFHDNGAMASYREEAADPREPQPKGLFRRLLDRLRGRDQFWEESEAAFDAPSMSAFVSPHIVARMARPQPWPLVEIDWIDSCGGGGWMDVEDIGSKSSATHCVTIGWVFHEDAEAITLAATFGKEGPGMHMQASDRITIPRCAIRGYRELRAAQ